MNTKKFKKSIVRMMSGNPRRLVSLLFKKERELSELRPLTNLPSTVASQAEMLRRQTQQISSLTADLSARRDQVSKLLDERNKLADQMDEERISGSELRRLREETARIERWADRTDDIVLYPWKYGLDFTNVADLNAFIASMHASMNAFAHPGESICHRLFAAIHERKIETKAEAKAFAKELAQEVVAAGMPPTPESLTTVMGAKLLGALEAKRDEFTDRSDAA